MATAENAKIQIETGQTLTAYAAMTDSGDLQVFTAGSIWSGQSGFTPSIRPNGVVTGRTLLTSGTTNDTVRIAAFTAYSKSVLKTISTATKTTITRAGTATKGQIHSVTMASDGSIAVVEGTISATQAFSEVFASAGGPPLIPVDSVSLGQIRVTTGTPDAITAAEILQVVGTHSERSDFPGWETSNTGNGAYADETGKVNSHIEFDSVLPASHTGPITKKTYIQYYTPIFSDLGRAMDFTAAENSHSVSSTQVYGNKTVGSSSSSLGQSSFSAMLNDGITDTLVSLKNEIITAKFFQDRNKAPYILTQGKLGSVRTFPVANQVQMSATLSAENASAEFTS